MNDKKAKMLRKNILFMFGKDDVKYIKEEVKRNKIETNNRNIDGSFVMIEHNGEQVKEFYTFPSITVRLGDCARKTYQEMKRRKE